MSGSSSSPTQAAAACRWSVVSRPVDGIERLAGRPAYFLGAKTSDFFTFSYLTVLFIQKFYINYKINKLLLKYL